MNEIFLKHMDHQFGQGLKNSPPIVTIAGVQVPKSKEN